VENAVLREAVVAELHRILGEDASTIGDLEKFLSYPPKPEMGDVAFGCFPLARLRRENPARIAMALATAVEPHGLIAQATAAGPYLNFHANPEALLDQACRAASQGALQHAPADQPQKVTVEHSQPNTHKVFHI